MRVAVIAPPAGPRTGSRTYAGQIIELLAATHDVIRLDAGARLDRDLLRDAELLHVLDAKSALGSVSVLEHAPFPLVVDLHDDYWTGRPRYPALDRPARALLWRRRRPRYLALLRRADAVVVHARHMLAAATHDRAVVVPIPVRPAPPGFARSKRGGSARVLFAGRDALRKGLPVLGTALRLLRSEGLTVQARVAGGDWAHLRAAARWWLRGVPTLFLGDLDDEAMSRAYAEADLLAAPSYTEAFGLVVQEALVHGLPVVASRVGGLEEILTPPSAPSLGLSIQPGGLLVPPHDPRALADAIRDIAENPDRWRKRARQAGGALAAVRTDRAALRALETAYEMALAHRRSRP